MTSKDKIPGFYTRTKEQYPKILGLFEELGKELRGLGALDAKTVELVKLAIAIGARMGGATHSATRKALKAGATKEEIRQVVLLASTTIGFPNMMAALSWVNDILE